MNEQACKINYLTIFYNIYSGIPKAASDMNITGKAKTPDPPDRKKRGRSPFR